MRTPTQDRLDADLYPFTLHPLDLPGGTVSYVDEGPDGRQAGHQDGSEGPTLLFVHTGMWSFVFRDVIVRLREHFRCVTLDFPGYGTAPDAERPPSARELSGILGEFVDALDLTDVTLVLHDLGGPVALAAGRSERIAALVLANTFLWTPDGRGLRAMFRVVGSRPVATLSTVTNLLPRLTSGRSGVGRHLSRAERAAFRVPYRSWARRWRFHSTMRSIFRDPELTGLAERHARELLRARPVLTIFGEKNDPFGFQDRIASMSADHEAVVVEGGNHFPMMDAPDLFADRVTDWHRRKVSPGCRAAAADRSR